MSDNQDWIKLAQVELAKIEGGHKVKKRKTILALVTARMRADSEETVWGMSDTCSRNTYHRSDTRADGSLKGWKHDPVFSSVLASVTEIALEWQENYALNEMQRRQEAWIEKTHDIGWEMIKKAEQMLKFPLQTVTTENGKTVIEPAKWTYSNVPGMVTSADKLVRLSVGLPTDVREQSIGGIDGSPIEVSSLSSLTDEELKALVENSTFLNGIVGEEAVQESDNPDG